MEKVVIININAGGALDEQDSAGCELRNSEIVGEKRVNEREDWFKHTHTCLLYTSRCV